MKNLKTTMILVTLFIPLGCMNIPPQPISTAPDFVVENIIPTGGEKYLNKNSEYIFDQTRLHTFELNIPGPAMTLLDSDPLAEKYVEGTLTFDGETMSPVGVRYKGSIGAFINCLSDRSWFKLPSGYKICTKLSMKVKINWKDPGRTFYGLKKLQFHSQNWDPSQMHERLAYWCFREMGVAAPRSVHARLIINGVYSGLYALTEQIDEQFAGYHFQNGSGNLYKEIWPVDVEGKPYTEKKYLKKLKTNKDNNPSAAMISSFAADIAEADMAGMRDVISKWMNVKEIMSYIVVDRTIKVDDGAFHWYFAGDMSGNHNYYWYEEPEINKLHLIPWDMDNTFENLRWNANPVTPIADDWGEISNDGKPFPYGLFWIKQRSAAADKLTAGWVSYKDEFEQLKKEFLDGSFSKERINAQLDAWEAQIREATAEARRVHKDALTVRKWERSLKKLKSDLQYARTFN